MDAASCTLRRANLDDLPALKGLWELALLPALELEKRLTEFQVMTRPDGILLGAIALRMAGHDALLHSEAFYSAEHQDDYRPLLWERLQVLARNHGLARIWTREQAPFWRTVGFNPAAAEDLKRLPPAFGQPQAAWSLLTLRSETLLTPSLEREFELFQLAQRENSERILRQARVFKWIAGLIAFGFVVGALILLVSVFLKPGRRPPR